MFLCPPLTLPLMLTLTLLSCHSSRITISRTLGLRAAEKPRPRGVLLGPYWIATGGHTSQMARLSSGKGVGPKLSEEHPE